MIILTPDLVQRIAEVFKVGGTLSIAANSLDLSLTQLKTWIKQGKACFQQSASPPAEFAECLNLYLSIRRAIAEFEIENATRLKEAAAGGSYQAAIALLDRRRKPRWNKKIDKIASLFQPPKIVIQGGVDERSLQ